VTAAPGVLLAAQLAIGGLVLLAGACRRAAHTLNNWITDAGAPELDDPPTRMPRDYRASDIEVDVLTIRYVDDAQRCKHDNCPACQLVNDTTRRRG
jgi:hypothetical protein